MKLKLVWVHNDFKHRQYVMPSDETIRQVAIFQKLGPGLQRNEAQCLFLHQILFIKIFDDKKILPCLLQSSVFSQLSVEKTITFSKDFCI